MKLTAGRVLDVFTAALGCFALYLMVQPGSWVRSRWDARSADRSTIHEVTRRWDSLIGVATPLGNTADEVSVLVFSDYECVFCRQSEPMIDSAVASGLRLGFVPVPRRDSESGYSAAIAVVCAEEFGFHHAMHSRLMTTKEWQKTADWREEARAVGVTALDEFQSCSRSASARRRVDQARLMADSVGISGTPTFVSRARVHRGLADLAILQVIAAGEQR